eukprot:TRINITY_DN17568_c0_g1_i1.p1 TRINITY_DN17568_c0_g1~~TRINITY_DN17568_c0_g1_i1.p1  ORF type:complete len:152 (-),score=37.61 TRINITY_DN17568_c0_g1_i1:55-510(-)
MKFFFLFTLFISLIFCKNPARDGTVNWAGSYNVNGGCSTASCCCLSGKVNVEQSGLAVTIISPLSGQCGGTTTTTIQFNLSSTNSSTASFNFGGDNFQAIKTGKTVAVNNLDSPQCSGSATCTSGSCLNSGALLFPSLLLLLIILAFTFSN